MCTNITERTPLRGSAKGADGWFPITGATIYVTIRSTPLSTFYAPRDRQCLSRRGAGHVAWTDGR
jgi:hypothetical protein